MKVNDSHLGETMKPVFLTRIFKILSRLSVANAHQRVNDGGGNSRYQSQHDENARAFVAFADVGVNPDCEKDVDERGAQNEESN